MIRVTRVSIVVTIALAAVIAVLTLMPPNQVEMPSGSDKTYHFLAFAALALPLAAVRPRWSVALFLVYSAFGGTIEIIQPLVGRSRELADLVADMAGIAVGMALGFLVHLLFRRRGGGRPSTGDESLAGTSASTGQV